MLKIYEPPRKHSSLLKLVSFWDIYTTYSFTSDIGVGQHFAHQTTKETASLFSFQQMESVGYTQKIIGGFFGKNCANISFIFTFILYKRLCQRKITLRDVCRSLDCSLLSWKQRPLHLLIYNNMCVCTSKPYLNAHYHETNVTFPHSPSLDKFTVMELVIVADNL